MSPSQSATPSAALFPVEPQALLALADGTLFRGRAIGAIGHAVGEVVFNTAMTGYQEILTDPSYAGQIVTLTYPHIGNVGVNAEDVESRKRVRRGTRDPRPAAPRVELARGRRPGRLPARANIVGIADIDTRKLTRILREKGAQNGCIVAAAIVGDADAEAALAACARRAVDGRARSRQGRVVRRARTNGAPARGRSATAIVRRADARFHVVAYDYGVEAQHPAPARAARLPAHRRAGADAGDATCSRCKPDGVFLSNGPGDPEPCDYAIAAIRELVDGGMPTFGICLGHQLLGLASGARTLKMKFGHHGANHPVLDKDTGHVVITSQNHGFAVDPASLPANVRVTHVSLFDGSLQGIARTDRPAFSFQGHPEASPGPHDLGYLFDRFVKLMEKK